MRTKSVMLRFTESELLRLQEAHKASGHTWVPFSSWLREQALRAVPLPASTAPAKARKPYVAPKLRPLSKAAGKRRFRGKR